MYTQFLGRMVIFYLLALATIFCYSISCMDNAQLDSSCALAENSSDVKELIVVRGVVIPEGGYFFPFYRIPANVKNLRTASRLPEAGTHSVVFLDAKGRVLLKIAWTPKFQSEQPPQTPIKAAFTWLVMPKKNVAEVQLRVDGKMVSGFSVCPVAPEIGAVKIKIISDSLDASLQRARLSWSVSYSGLDDAIKASRVLYQVYYSNNNGETWTLVKSGFENPEATIDLTKLPGGRRCLFKVSITDGFNSGHRIGRPFSVANKRPLCVLVAPRSGKTYYQGSGVLLIGRCIDLEDGDLPEASLVWISEPQGVIGYGRKLVTRDLHIGTHQITLTSRDSAGNRSISQPLHIEIIPRRAN